MLELFQKLQPVEKAEFFGFVIILLITLIILVKTGLLTFQGKEFKIGAVDSKSQSDKKLKIIKAQFEYLDNKIPLIIRNAHKLSPIELDEWYVKFVAERAKSIIHEWIVFDKINNPKEYINSKTKQIMTIIKTFTNEPLSVTSVLSALIEKQVEDLILELIEVEKAEKRTEKVF